MDLKDEKFIFIATHSKRRQIFKITLYINDKECQVKVLAPIADLVADFKSRRHEGSDSEFRWYEGSAVLNDKTFLICEARSSEVNILTKDSNSPWSLKTEGVKLPIDTYTEGLDVDYKNMLIYVSDREGNIYWTSLKKFSSKDAKNRPRNESTIWEECKVPQIDHCQEVSVDQKGGLWIAAEYEVIYVSDKFFNRGNLKNLQLIIGRFVCNLTLKNLSLDKIIFFVYNQIT